MEKLRHSGNAHETKRVRSEALSRIKGHKGISADVVVKS